MSDNGQGKVVTVWLYVVPMKNLHSIFCKVNANGNKIFPLLKPHSSFRFHYRLLTMKTFFEIAVNQKNLPLLAYEIMWFRNCLPTNSELNRKTSHESFNQSVLQSLY